VLPTCAELAGLDLLQEPILDGRSLLGSLTGRKSKGIRSLFFNYRSHAALRYGEWKIVREAPDDPWHLYHLTKDLAERLDLASEHPDKLDQLLREYRSWQQRLP
jgi:arylsulfatase